MVGWEEVVLVVFFDVDCRSGEAVMDIFSVVVLTQCAGNGAIVRRCWAKIEDGRESSIFTYAIMRSELRGRKRRNETRLTQLLKKITLRRENMMAATEQGSCHGGC